MKVSFILNGKYVSVDVKPNEILLDVLRYRLGIKSVKRGCERGECGACTVLLDGKPVYSCMLLAVQVDGHEITTVEGLEHELRPLIKAFTEVGAIQCGYCTPGILLTAYTLLKNSSDELTENDVKKALEGNLCRCTGYKKIVEAILQARKYYKKI